MEFPRIPRHLALSALVLLILPSPGLGDEDDVRVPLALPKSAYWDDFDHEIRWLFDPVIRSIGPSKGKMCVVSGIQVCEFISRSNATRLRFHVDASLRFSTGVSHPRGQAGGFGKISDAEAAAIRAVCLSLPPSDRNIGEDDGVAVGFWNEDHEWVVRVYDRTRLSPAVVKLHELVHTRVLPDRPRVKPPL